MNIRSAVCCAAMFVAFFAAGCRTSDDRLREIVREELHAASERSIITTGSTIGPYSPAQRIGKFLFVSGQIGIDPATGIFPGDDIESQTRQALENLMTVLRRAGCDSSDVITTTVYLTDIRDYAPMNLIYGGYFPEDRYPARTTMQVVALPRTARVEITAIAHATD